MGVTFGNYESHEVSCTEDLPHIDSIEINSHLRNDSRLQTAPLNNFHRPTERVGGLSGSTDAQVAFSVAINYVSLIRVPMSLANTYLCKTLRFVVAGDNFYCNCV